MSQTSRKTDSQVKDHIIKVCGATHIGLVRENNEDAYLINEKAGIFIVADGMGGQNAGEIASIEAVQGIREYFECLSSNGIGYDIHAVRDHMNKAMFFANRRVFQKSKSNRECFGMGCALIIAWLINNELYTCHVGDVRAYICSKRGINQITKDQSEAARLVRFGKMTPEELRNSHLRNVLTQAVGSEKIFPEFNHRCIEKRDRVLLCSDGLWDMLLDEEILNIVMGTEKLSDICKKVIGAALNAGGRDNITAVIFENSIAMESQ
jgi:PPM family protein phosphatase